MVVSNELYSKNILFFYKTTNECGWCFTQYSPVFAIQKKSNKCRRWRSADERADDPWNVRIWLLFFKHSVGTSGGNCCFSKQNAFSSHSISIVDCCSFLLADFRSFKSVAVYLIKVATILGLVCSFDCWLTDRLAGQTHQILLIVSFTKRTRNDASVSHSIINFLKFNLFIFLHFALFLNYEYEQ